MLEVIAGFDIGGTKVSLVLADSAGKPLRRSVEPTATSSDSIEHRAAHTIYGGLALQLERMLRAALHEAGHPPLRSIGIVSAGPLRDGGLWNPPNIVPERIAEPHRALPRVIPLVDPLKEAFSCPVGLLNDCNGAVLGEAYYGVGKDTEDKSALYLAYATISTGFGVGAWDGGHLVLGKDGNAGELGHIVVREGGLPCGCGNRGCAEAYASGSGIVRNARSRLLSLRPEERAASALIGLLLDRSGPSASRSALESLVEKLTASLVFEAAGRKDPVACAVLGDAVLAAGVAFSAIANAYDPAILSVGGAIALAHPEILGPIRDEMCQHLNVVAPEVRLTPLGAEVTERGAIALAQRLLSD